jgi:two-component system cell cycle sensor histidine kinase/response regulator CckA
MDADTTGHIFGPFYTTKAPGQGTRLGLATVYGVIAQSGGCTSVTSEVDVGTTFDIYLPRFDHVAERPGGGSAAEVARTRPTILVVDDDSRFRAVTAKMLVKKGFRVLPAGDGEHAIWVLENSDAIVDLVLTDVVLSGTLQGLHIAERVS